MKRRLIEKVLRDLILRDDMNFPRRTRPRVGFTLLELLLATAIVGILIAIVLPIFSSIQERGRQTLCVGNLKQIGVALMAYAGDHNMQLPVVSFDPYFNKENYWQGQIAPYLGHSEDPETDLRYAPGDWTGDNPKFPDRNMKVFQCPSSFRVPSDNIWAGNSYGINRYLWTTFMPWKHVSLRNLQSPSQVFLVMDSSRYVIADPLTAAAGRVHRGRKNILFCDLHISANYHEEEPLPDGSGWYSEELWGDTLIGWAWPNTPP